MMIFCVMCVAVAATVNALSMPGFPQTMPAVSSLPEAIALVSSMRLATVWENRQWERLFLRLALKPSQNALIISTR